MARDMQEKTLTYWFAECYVIGGNPIRTRTRREAEVELRLWGSEDFGPILPVVVKYNDILDLVDQCMTNEGPHLPEEEEVLTWSLVNPPLEDPV